MQLIRKIRKLGLKLGFQKLIGYEAIFSCAFCTREHGKELYRTSSMKDTVFSVLSHTKEYWYADPLLWEQEGKEVVFLERVDRRTGLGCISCSDITDGSWKEPVPVIRENYHMSFPMCFEWGGELLMIPETEMNKSVNLYRCVDFPYQWDKVGEFLKGRKLVDSIVWSKEEDKVSILASEYDPNDVFYTRYYKYELCKKNGHIDVCDKGKVSDFYTLMSRMAGPAIKEKVPLVPIQRSTSGIYGYSVQFCEKGKYLPDKQIKELLPADFNVMRHNNGIGRKLIGVHTYSQSSHFEVIDIQYLIYNKNKWRKDACATKQHVGKFERSF